MSSAKQITRLQFVDSLRGIAASAVVVSHLVGAVALVAPNSDWHSAIIVQIFSLGYLGVDLFFVISGFVIPYSILSFKPSIHFLGRFALRRSIRLDPPYWVTIAVEILVVAITLQYFRKFTNLDFPSFEKLVAHFIYAQNLLGYGDILDVFWTLCFEVQFYLFFVTCLSIAQFVARIAPLGLTRLFVKLVAATLFIYSVLVFFVPSISTLPGLFVSRWFQFFLGYLAMRAAIQKKFTTEFVAAIIFISMASLVFPQGADNGVTAIVTASLLVIAANKGKMGSWLAWREIQFLGMISYSLYLVHSIAGWRTIRFVGLYVGDTPSTWVLWMLFLLGVLASIIAAWLMYRLVESPSIRLSRMIALDQPINWKDLGRTISIRWPFALNSSKGKN